ncbi:head-tail connector protein [Erythrobacter sp. Alg231-14]|uniref:head-tail connector protein n=1 Tax=Erythrobacter sp. Alg231-14 TaxID=1922225 RepID=UPI000D558991
MRRTILEPADVSATALAELKAWLGISRQNEDELLIGLLRASLDVCEAFTGQAPLSQLIEEQMPTSAGRYAIASRPVSSLIVAQIVGLDGAQSALNPDKYEIEFQAIGNACFTLLQSVEGQAVAIRLRVGIASDWETLPAAIKQGLIRLAAYHYRDRDRPGNAKKEVSAPSSVTALWRPWRTMRLQ